MIKSPPSKDALTDVLSFSTFPESEDDKKKKVGRSHFEIEADHRLKNRRNNKHTGKKGGTLPSCDNFGCESEKTDLRDTPNESYFDKHENCIHGYISTITQCCNIKECQGFHFIDDGLGGSRYRLACPGVSSR